MQPQRRRRRRLQWCVAGAAAGLLTGAALAVWHAIGGTHEARWTPAAELAPGAPSEPPAAPRRRLETPLSEAEAACAAACRWAAGASSYPEGSAEAGLLSTLTLREAADVVMAHFVPPTCEEGLYCPGSEAEEGVGPRRGPCRGQWCSGAFDAGAPQVPPETAACLPPVPVLWAKTNQAAKWLPAAVRALGPGRRFVLVTGFSDDSTPGKHERLLDTPGLVKWYGHHGLPAGRDEAWPDPRYEAVPLGLSVTGPMAAHYRAHGSGGPSRPPVLFDERRTLRERPDAPLAVWNCGMTHPLRRYLHERFCGDGGGNKGLARVECDAARYRSSGDASSDGGGNDDDDDDDDDEGDKEAPWGTNERKRALYARLAPAFKYWLSPRGNGRDAYRTWEALAMGMVPVVTRDSFPIPAEEAARDLPVLVLSSWDELTDELLERHARTTFSYERLTDPAAFPRRMLSRDYWVQKVRATAAAAAAGGATATAAAAGSPPWAPAAASDWPRCWGRRPGGG